MKAPRQTFEDYCTNPPAESALARAIAFGIDPTITFHNMFALTPEQRMTRAGRIIRGAQAIAKARDSSRT